MTKSEAVSRLAECGFEATIENSTVMVIYTGEPPFDKVKGILREAGYKQSFGVRGSVKKRMVGLETNCNIS